MWLIIDRDQSIIDKHRQLFTKEIMQNIRISAQYFTVHTCTWYEFDVCLWFNSEYNNLTFFKLQYYQLMCQHVK